ncbi:MAG TPA: carbohydrate ABC transporter permease [Limnochordia bacterium]
MRSSAVEYSAVGVLRPDRGRMRWVGLSVVTLLAVLALFPLVWMVQTALQPAALVLSFPPRWTWPVLDNFRALFGREHLLRWTLNSGIVAVAVTFLELLFCSMAGYAFAKKRFHGRETLFWLYIGSMMVPGQVTLIPLFILLSRLGLVDTYWGLILPFVGSPFGVFLMRQQMQTLPTTLLEAARIDGCGEIRTFTQIVLPLVKPGLAVLAVFTFVSQWNAFLWPLVATTSSSMRTLQVGLAMLQEEVPLNYGLLMAGASFAALPIVCVFFLFLPYFLQGVRIGGLKE